MREPWTTRIRPAAVALLVLAMEWPGLAAAIETPPADAGHEVLGEAAGSGEQCLVCRHAAHDEMVTEVRYKGRVFHVKSSMLGDFAADPEASFRLLQSRSALFDENAIEAPMGAGGHNGWLVFSLYVLAGLIFGALCGALAVARGRDCLPWFLAGLLLNVFALAALLIRRRGHLGGPQGIPRGLTKVPTTRAPRSCPRCGTPNHPAASACSRCSRSLSPVVAAETACLEGGPG